MEPAGTYAVMAKPIAVKFYVPPDQMRRCERIFKRQGVNLSEGLTRLIRLLNDAPEEMKGVILGQAHGDAALALARSVIHKAEEEAREDNPGELHRPNPGTPARDFNLHES